MATGKLARVELIVLQTGRMGTNEIKVVPGKLHKADPTGNKQLGH